MPSKTDPSAAAFAPLEFPTRSRALEVTVTTRSFVGLLLTAAGFACSGPPEEVVDAGPVAVDAGPTDAGPVDAGEADAGVADAGEADAGELDAGVIVRAMRGHVVEGGSRVALVGAEISLEGARLVAITDENGDFEIAGLPPGVYRVRVRQGIHADQLIDVAFDGSTGIGELAASAPGALTGTVKGGGTPVEGARVVAEGFGMAISKADGTFTLGALPAGVHRIGFQLPARTEISTRSVTITPGAAATLVVDLDSGAGAVKGAIAGVVRVFGRDAIGVTVSLYGGTTPIVVGTTGADGAFAAADLDAGIYRLVANKAGLSTAQFAPVVISGAAAALPALLLVPEPCPTGLVCPTASLADGDQDGRTDAIDNCLAIANPLQEDANSNGVGDACEAVIAPPPLPDPCPCSISETFDDAAALDAARTTGAVSGGKAAVDPVFTIAPIGTGATTALTNLAQITGPGSYRFTSVTLTGGVLTLTGDLEIISEGAVTLNYAQLRISGNLTIRAGGAIVSTDGYLQVTGGLLKVEQPTTAGVSLLEGAQGGSYWETFGVGSTAIAPDLVIRTAGPLVVGSRCFVNTGNRTGSAGLNSGNLVLDAGGDLSIGPTGAYVFSGKATGQAGTVTLRTGGKLSVGMDAFVLSGDSGGNGATGGDFDLHAAGGMHFDGCTVRANYRGRIEAHTEGDVVVTGSGQLAFGTAGLLLTARDVTLSDYGYIGPASRSGAASAEVRATGSLTAVTGGDLESGGGYCLSSGALSVVAGGDLVLDNDSYVGGTSVRLNGGCTTGVGGDLTLRLGGAVQYTDTKPTAPTPLADVLTAGGGPEGAGAQSITEHADVALEPADARFAPAVVFTSTAQRTDRPRALSAVQAVMSDAAAAHLVVSPDGLESHFRAAAVGVPLEDNFRWRVKLQPRLFTPLSADSISLSYE